jgi:hypothetical protein
MSDLPASWSAGFPSSSELAAEAVIRIPTGRLTADSRLERRHSCEFTLFKIVEEHHLTPAIARGFKDVPGFLGLAQSTLQRRKSRAGRSLEHHLARIFEEEGVAFDAQKVTESGHRPDFVFPSIITYRAAQTGDPRVTVLASKSTLRDRWRQVLREADKVPVKYLLTLDEGLSEAQCLAIRSAGIRLVVPAGRITSFPKSVRGDLVSLAAFISTRLRVQGANRLNGDTG